jgi:hypothetical protein
LHHGGVILRDQVRAGQHRQATAEHVQVRLVKRQHQDGQVALEVWLLVNCERDLAVLDTLRDVGVKVEGSQLG